MRAFHRVCAPSDAPILVSDDEAATRRVRIAAETDTVVENPYVGPYAAYVMRPFNYPTSSRFSDGTYGVHYSANLLEVAKAEHAFHLAQALRDANMPAGEFRRAYITLDFRSSLPPIAARPELLDPDDYSASQAYGARRYSAGDPGLHYPSVRKVGGFCAGLFRPALATQVYLITDSLVCLWDEVALRFVSP